MGCSRNVRRSSFGRHLFFFNHIGLIFLILWCKMVLLEFHSELPCVIALSKWPECPFWLFLQFWVQNALGSFSSMRTNDNDRFDCNRAWLQMKKTPKTGHFHGRYQLGRGRHNAEKLWWANRHFFKESFC